MDIFENEKPITVNIFSRNKETFPYKVFALLSLVIVSLFGWGPNFLLCLFSVTVLFLGSWLSWRPGEPAVIFYVFVFQWIQASIAIFIANITGIPIDDWAQMSASKMGEATFLSLLGLLTIVMFFRVAAGEPKYAIIDMAKQQVDSLTFKQLSFAYGFTFFGSFFIKIISSNLSVISQPLLAINTFSNAMFFVVAYTGFRRGGEFRLLFIIAFFIEFISSLVSYFSSFQAVFVYTFIAMLSVKVRLRSSDAVKFGVVAALAIFAGVVWSAAKGDYRDYLNQGTGQQVVDVKFTDALSALTGNILSLNAEQLADGAEALASRLSYVELLGASMNVVPEYAPHTGGSLWWNAVIHPFMPRLLFPDKAETDSSAQTNMYTGVQVAGREEGTQISIGYMGESYLDYGRFGMFVPLALFGAFLGYVYRKVLLLREFAGILSMGLCVPLVMGFSYLNAETIKIVGHMAVTALVLSLSHFLAGEQIQKILLGKRRRMPASNMQKKKRLVHYSNEQPRAEQP
jgi:hypothetical protein